MWHVKYLSFNHINILMSYTLQIQESTDQATITVPKAMRKAKGWENKEELEWKINDNGNLVLLKNEN